MGKNVANNISIYLSDHTVTFFLCRQLHLLFSSMTLWKTLVVLLILALG